MNITLNSANGEPDRPENQNPDLSRRVVYGVTVGVSALKLLRGQLRWLGQQGWDVKLVTTPDEAAHAAALHEESELYPLPMSRNISPLADCVALWRWLRLLTRLKPAVVNVSTPKAGLIGGSAAWIKRIPRRIYVVRGLRLEGAKGMLRVVLWFTEWLAMKVATDVLFVSPSLAEESNRLRLLNRSKSWVIGAGSSNGVDAQAVEARVALVNRDELKLNLNFASDDFIVGFIGRIAKDKGLETLVHTFSDKTLDSRARLLCIGPIEDEDVSNMVRGLGEKVRTLPWTSDVWGHLPAMDVLCLPTLREGFPNVVLEAAAAGIPTITTFATGAIDSVVDGHTGFLINVGDSEALVAKINVLAGSMETVKRLGTAAKQRVLLEFQQEGIWQGVEEIMSGTSKTNHATRVNNPLNKGENK